jgi:hypothetical protein
LRSMGPLTFPSPWKGECEQSPWKGRENSV